MPSMTLFQLEPYGDAGALADARRHVAKRKSDGSPRKRTLSGLVHALCDVRRRLVEMFDE